jgi:transcriptional regulator with XRE-family HTH domain
MKIYWNGKSKNIIGENVKTLRKQMGLTQKALAEKLQLEGHEFSDLTVLRIEQGTRFVPDYEVVALADFFKVSTEEILRTKI